MPEISPKLLAKTPGDQAGLYITGLGPQEGVETKCKGTCRNSLRKHPWGPNSAIVYNKIMSPGVRKLIPGIREIYCFQTPLGTKSLLLHITG